MRGSDLLFSDARRRPWLRKCKEEQRVREIEASPYLDLESWTRLGKNNEEFWHLGSL